MAAFGWLLASQMTVNIANKKTRLPVSRGGTPAGAHEADEGLRAVLRDGWPMSLIHNHEEDLAHSQALEQTGACIHLPHCITQIHAGQQLASTKAGAAGPSMPKLYSNGSTPVTSA